MSSLDDFLKKLLDKRLIINQQKYTDNQLKKEENQREINQFNWLGVDSNTGQGIALNEANQLVKGNIIFNGQQIPGQTVLGLSASQITFNAMPAPHQKVSQKSQYTPRRTTGKVAIIAELIYEDENGLLSSCK